MNNENLKEVYERQNKKKLNRLSKSIGKAFIVVALGFGGGAAGSYFMNNQGTTVVTQSTTTKATGTSKDASSISSKMTQSVVAITTENISRDNFWYGSQVSSGAGSGVIMSSDGYIITCAHVVTGASTIKVTTSDNKTYDATLVGTYSDGKNKLTMYKLISDTTLPAIQQLNVQIDQDKTISDELEKINTTGTQIIRKTYIVPIENSILYVEPVYQVLLNEQSKVPTLKKVIVASGTKVAIGDDLVEALTTLLTDSAGKIEFVNTEDKQQLINAIIKASKNLKESTESKNWELIGTDIEKLQTLIDQLEAVEKQNTETTNNKSGFLDSKE